MAGTEKNIPEHSVDDYAGKGSVDWIKPTKSVDDWLPVTGSRDAKWWFSAFHIVTSVVGAGVLGLPRAMTSLGWGPGVVVLVVSWVITLYTLWQMVEMHEMVPGKRFNRYHELGQHVFGEKLGLWIVVPQQLIVEIGVDIVYMVTGGMSLKKFHDTVCLTCSKTREIYWIMSFASVHFILAQLPTFNSIALVSLAAAVMSLSYSTIAWTASLSKRSHDASHSSYPNVRQTNELFEAFNALGQVAFSYAGHNLILEIQATMPSTSARPSKVPMWWGVILAYVIVALCYFPVAFVGYWAFGDSVNGDILITLEDPRWLIATANMMVVIHVIGSYQLYAMPVYDMMEIFLVKKLHCPPGILLRVIARSAYVAFTCFGAVCIPFFSALLGFFGGFAFAPTTYFLPCIMWLAIKKPKPFSLSWITNWVCIILGVFLMIVSCVGGLYKIIKSASGYQFFTGNQTSSDQLFT